MFWVVLEMKEQTETLEKLTRIDILIKERVCLKDVEFADLKAIIIDEEQRFGVKHKEALKKELKRLMS